MVNSGAQGERGLLDWRGTRFFLFFLVFGAVPLLAGVSLFHHLLASEENARRVRLEDALDQAGGELVRAVDPLVFLQGRMKALSEWARGSAYSDARLVRITERARTHWGFVLEPGVFDDAGQLRTPREIPLKSRFLMQKFWTLLTILPTDFSRVFPLEKKKINAFLGKDLELGPLRLQPDWTTGFFFLGRRAAIFWSRYSPRAKAGFLGFIWNLPQPQTLLGRTLRSPFFRDLRVIAGEGQTAGDRSGKELTALLDRRFSLSGKRFEWLDGILWTRLAIEGRKYFLGMTAPNLSLAFWKTTVWLAFLLGSSALAWFWFRWIFLEARFYVSIRPKLLLLFLTAMAFPLAGFVFLARQTLDDHARVLENRVNKSAKELLLQLDGELPTVTRRFLRLCRQVRDHPAWKKNPTRLLKRLKELQESGRLLHFEVRNLQGVLQQKFADVEFSEGYAGFFDAVGKLMIRKYLPERLEREKTEIVRPPDPATQAILENPGAGMNLMLRSRNSVFSAQFGSQAFFLYYDLLAEPGHPLAFIAVTQAQSFAMREFLRQKLSRGPKTRRESLPDEGSRGDYLLFARDNTSGTWYPERPRDIRRLNALLDRVALSGQFVSESFSCLNQQVLAVACPGMNLRQYSLVALYPERKILEKVAGTRREFLAFGVLVAGFALIVGWSLSLAFLQPVRELGRGLEALSRHDTSYRITALHADEMGTLARTFNQVMEDLNEMQLAGVIQESLIPSLSPEIPGYETYLRYRVAERLGGDYCDILPARDGRWLVVIGDVTGHGAGSALMMTMVKAAVFDHARRGTGLEEMFAELTTLIAEVFQRRLLMTFCGILLDPLSGNFEFVDAGHPFPLLVKPTGETQEIAMSQMPLGMSTKRTSFVPSCHVMAHQEFLLFFSDGIMEALNPAGEMFGYEGFHRVLARNTYSSMNELGEQIWQAVTEFQGRERLDDDATLILIRRGHV